MSFSHEFLPSFKKVGTTALKLVPPSLLLAGCMSAAYTPKSGDTFTVTKPISAQSNWNTHTDVCTIPEGAKLTVVTDKIEPIYQDQDYFNSTETVQVRIDLSTLPANTGCAKLTYPRSLKQLTENAKFEAIVQQVKQQIIQSRTNK